MRTCVLQGWCSLCKLSVGDLGYVQVPKEVLVPVSSRPSEDVSAGCRRAVRGPLPPDDCRKTDKTQGRKLWEWSYYGAGTQKQLSGVPPLAVSRAVGIENDSFSVS